MTPTTRSAEEFRTTERAALYRRKHLSADSNAAPVRWCVCEGLEFLGVRLDPDCNAAHAPTISRDASPVTVRVMRTDEDLMIARHTSKFIGLTAKEGA